MPEPVQKIGGYVPVTVEAMRHSELMLKRALLVMDLATAVDRKFNPWAYPDRNPMPIVTIWPEWWRRVIERLRRRWPLPV